MYCIYTYSDPRDGIFYIGKGTLARAQSHLHNLNNNAMEKRVQSIKNAGLEVIIEIISQNLTAKEAAIAHQQALDTLGVYPDGPLLNKHKTRNGHSEIAKARMRKAWDGRRTDKKHMSIKEYAKKRSEWYAIGRWLEENDKGTYDFVRAHISEVLAHEVKL